MKVSLLHSLMVVVTLAAFSTDGQARDNRIYLYVLGVAQDAGYPQSGCYESHCVPGWKNPALRRGATSIAVVDGFSGSKYMFDATPDLPEQLYRLETRAPSNDYRLNGIFLTHAHIGHYTGLMFLGHESMGASDVPVYAMPRMLQFLSSNGPWSQLVNYKNIQLKPLRHTQTQILGRLQVTPFLVPHRDEYSETVGFRIAGPKKTAVFIPDINKWKDWETRLADLVESVDYALIDATFFDNDELPGRDMSNIPHPFVMESMNLLKNLPPEERGKVWFIHLNHTNPLLNPDSSESQLVRERGFNIAFEGLELPL